MADNITAPLVASTVIASDEVTRDALAVHVQFMKVLDGTDGSINPLAIDQAGAVSLGRNYYCAEAGSAVVDATHGDGELLCDPINLGTHYDGVLLNYRVMVAAMTPTLVLDPVNVILIPVVPSSDVSRFGVEGAVPGYTANDWRNSIVLESTDFATPPALAPAGMANCVRWATSPVGSTRPIYVDTAGALGVVGHEHELYALIMADGASTVDYTAAGVGITISADWAFPSRV